MNADAFTRHWLHRNYHVAVSPVRLTREEVDPRDSCWGGAHDGAHSVLCHLLRLGGRGVQSRQHLYQPIGNCRNSSYVQELHGLYLHQMSIDLLLLTIVQEFVLAIESDEIVMSPH